MSERLTIKALQTDLGVDADGIFGKLSKAALIAKITNTAAPAITKADYSALAQEWGVPTGHITGVTKVEAPRGAFDKGRVAILYERHKFRNNTIPNGRFNRSNPDLSGLPYGPGGYGTYSAQYDKLARACALDPEAAFRACSWGAFQVLGENAVDLGYSSAYEMAKALATSEAAHLESFKRFVEHNGLIPKLRMCIPDVPNSCIPFVSAYNGSGFRRFNYHVKLAAAI